MSQTAPHLTALEILDRTVGVHDGRSLDYEFEHELEPPHRFAELIRRAFAPHLDRYELIISFTEDEPGDVIRTEWRVATMLFAKRYSIWEPEK